MKKIILRMFQFALIIYLAICAYMYIFQESLIFAPKDLQTDYQFAFDQSFEELMIASADGAKLNGLLFKADSSKGLIFYLHGKTGSLDTWGTIAHTYTSRGYDIFIWDYRGYGKSEGKISSETQFFEDAQYVYNALKKDYSEDKIIVLGYSIGTGTASMIAAQNNPRKLILQAPYYNLVDFTQRKYPIIPSFLLRYPFDNATFIQQVKAPVTIIHGDADETIYYGSSLKLKEHFKAGDQLFTLDGGTHKNMSNNKEYLDIIGDVLDS